jgi:hypothetical protein
MPFLGFELWRKNDISFRYNLIHSIHRAIRHCLIWTLNYNTIYNSRAIWNKSCCWLLKILVNDYPCNDTNWHEMKGWTSCPLTNPIYWFMFSLLSKSDCYFTTKARWRWRLSRIWFLCPILFFGVPTPDLGRCSAYTKACETAIAKIVSRIRNNTLIRLKYLKAFYYDARLSILLVF